jgi:hypothetical protein
VHTYRFFYPRTETSILVTLNEAESNYLQTCLENGTQWFILAEQAINLHQVAMIESE